MAHDMKIDDDAHKAWLQYMRTNNPPTRYEEIRVTLQRVFVAGYKEGRKDG